MLYHCRMMVLFHSCVKRWNLWIHSQHWHCSRVDIPVFLCDDVISDMPLLQLLLQHIQLIYGSPLYFIISCFPAFHIFFWRSLTFHPNHIEPIVINKLLILIHILYCIHLNDTSLSPYCYYCLFNLWDMIEGSDL